MTVKTAMTVHYNYLNFTVLLIKFSQQHLASAQNCVQAHVTPVSETH